METCKNYLTDLTTILLDKLKELEDEATSSAVEDYLRGQIMAYYDTLSIIKSQAELFDISVEELNSLDLERYLML